MVLVDWVRALSGHSQRAISHACDEYIRTGDYPPKPSDIIARVEAFEQRAARRSIQGDSVQFSDSEAAAIDWAVRTNRLHMAAARSAVAGARSMSFPDWMPGDETQRAVYAIRHHPEYNPPEEQPKKKFGGAA